MNQFMNLKTFPKAALAAALVTASLAAVAGPTLTFDELPTAPGVSGTSSLVAANGGSRTVHGVVFNASANSDWEVYGNQFRAFGDNPFADSHSGAYAIAGNAFSGIDTFGNSYGGLTISTNLVLSSMYVGFDDDGGGSNDADSVTITAFGANGDLASASFTLSSKALSLVDTSTSFGSLNGIIGYRFETTAADALNEAFGRAYVIADDMRFENGPTPAVPEPSSVVLVLTGLALLRWRRACR